MRSSSFLLCLLVSFSSYVSARPYIGVPSISPRSVSWKRRYRGRREGGLLASTGPVNGRATSYRVSSANRRANDSTTWVTRLTLFNVCMYGLQVFRPSVTRWGIKLSDRILRGEELYRLVSPVFLHSTPIHLITNLVSLQRIGPDVERYFGAGRFLLSYIAAGIAGNYVSALQSPNPSLGASGAVFGVVGAYMTFIGRNEVS